MNKKTIGIQAAYLWNEESYNFCIEYIRNNMLIENPDYIDGKFSDVNEFLNTKKMEDVSVSIYGKNETYIFFFGINYINRIFRIDYNVIIDLNIALNLIEKLSKSENFILGYIFDSHDAYWQSEEKIENYKNEGINYEHLPTTKDWFGNKCIDISHNYGRQRFEGGIMYMAAPYMYFGNPFYKLIPKNQLLAFNDCVSNTEDNNVLKIKLIDDIFKSNSTIGRERQKSFWDKILLDKLNQLEESGYRFDGFPF